MIVSISTISMANNETDQWGQAILRMKTTLIKPYSKVKYLKEKTSSKKLFSLIVY